MTQEELDSKLKEIVPKLDGKNHKGQFGKVCVIGGCREYTGAPYFGSVTALKVGSDLAHIICTEGSGAVIKSYSPELIVHPYLQEEDFFVNKSESEKKKSIENILKLVENWTSKFTAFVVGPGIGRDVYIQTQLEQIIQQIVKFNKPLIIDADGLFLITQKPEIVKGNSQVVLTPNAMELFRLANKVGLKLDKVPSELDERIHITEKISQYLDGVTIVSKGAADVITTFDKTILCKQEGSARRCGGQGDLLSGSMGVLSSWVYNQLQGFKVEDQKTEKLQIAAYGACKLTRLANKIAFKEFELSMTTTDMLSIMNQSVK